MNKERAYFDHNATAPVLAEAREAACAAMDLLGNPSSVHGEGRAARQLIELARGDLAALIGAKSQEIIFTSGGTEANNLALAGLPAEVLVVSAVEHDSILGPARGWGDRLTICPVEEDGLIDLSALERSLSAAKAPALVSIMLANNETGIIQPISKIARLVKLYDGFLHCDAIQAPGRLPLDVQALGVDMLSLSGHKIGALKGIGALWVREGLAVRAQQSGGGQELGRRSGTENLAGIASFGAAAREAKMRFRSASELQDLRDWIETSIANFVGTDALIIGKKADRLANTSAIRMPGMPAETQVMNFDLEGIAVSAGSACSSGKVKTSHVLKAMGMDPTEAGEVIRVSLGPENTMAEAERFVESWKTVFERARRRSNATATLAS